MTDSSQHKVLVIDDDTTQQILVREYLGNAGFVVRVSENGSKGLKFARSQNPDVILLDVLLPDMDGYEVCSQLKNSAETSSIPVILITGSREDDVIRRGIEVGAADFVTKPVDWEFLADRVQHVLRQKTIGPDDTSSHAVSAAAVSDEKKAAEQAKIAEIKELRSALETARRRIDELTRDLSEQKSAANAEPATSEFDFHAQISAVEEEWTNRLQQSLSQANKRAEARLQQQQSRFELALEQATNENKSLQRKIKEERLEQVQELEKLVRDHDRALDAAINRMSEQTAEEREQLLTEEKAKRRNSWRYVSNLTEDSRESLRRIQDAMIELRRNANTSEASEGLYQSIDGLTGLIASEISKASQFHELVLHAGGEVEQQIELVAPGQIVDRLSGVITTQSKRRDVTIESELDPALSIEGTEQDIQTVLHNLISNAVRYSPPNGKVSVQSTLGPNQEPVIRVIDRGFGIDSALMLELNQYLDASETPVPTSPNWKTIGIPLTKAILDGCGGTLSISSELGRGTTAEVTLKNDAATNNNVGIETVDEPPIDQGAADRETAVEFQDAV